MKKKAILVSGCFNPIHKGHPEYFNYSKVRGLGYKIQSSSWLLKKL
jgi:glycerol-3-phosphate cytidylyltransferase-like family protein